ncbi:MAG: hypothetical protein KJ767_01160 [Nanoarchaeota archaeon]|nr:hypothetical protein [Nanoarchaeota archaeon]
MARESFNHKILGKIHVNKHSINPIRIAGLYNELVRLTNGEQVNDYSNPLGRERARYSKGKFMGNNIFFILREEKTLDGYYGAELKFFTYNGQPHEMIDVDIIPKVPKDYSEDELFLRSSGYQSLEEIKTITTLLEEAYPCVKDKSLDDIIKEIESIHI